jgi:hypothetical protein
MQQGVGEIGAKQNGDCQTNERLGHGEPFLKTPAGARIGANEDEKQNPGADKGKIEHDASPYQRCGLSSRRARNS